MKRQLCSVAHSSKGNIGLLSDNVDRRKIIGGERERKLRGGTWGGEEEIKSKGHMVQTFLILPLIRSNAVLTWITHLWTGMNGLPVSSWQISLFIQALNRVSLYV